MRAPMGRLKTRALLVAAFMTELETAPIGRYFVLFYNSKFERETIQEKVVVSLEGGAWRVEGFGPDSLRAPDRMLRLHDGK